MSKQELVTAYLKRRIGRREFIAGLCGLGISLPAAMAYAQALGGGEPAAGDGLRRDEQGFLVSARLSATEYVYLPAISR